MYLWLTCSRLVARFNFAGFSIDRLVKIKVADPILAAVTKKSSPYTRATAPIVPISTDIVEGEKPEM
jgi:hypothetical protein